jgi:hypothetical protein
MENSYYINDASECKYLEEFDHLEFVGSVSIGLEKETKKKNVTLKNLALDIVPIFIKRQVIC